MLIYVVCLFNPKQAVVFFVLALSFLTLHYRREILCLLMNSNLKDFLLKIFTLNLKGRVQGGKKVRSVKKSKIAHNFFCD